MGPRTSPEQPARPYHHGDLRRALIDVATDAARASGPDAVVLRDIARQVGVSHNAGYRHFANRDALLAAVAGRAGLELGRAMQGDMASVPPGSDPRATALARLRAVGRRYVTWAHTEPGLFRTTFAASVPFALAGEGRDGEGGGGEGGGGEGPDAYAVLVAALDDLVLTGAMSPARRPQAELVAWSSVHGLASLIVDGPLRDLPGDQIEAAITRICDVVETGLVAP